jgi:hypothetical protein
MSKYLDLSSYKNNLQLEREKHLAEEAVALTNKQKLSLYKKSQKSGYSTDILEEVYRRGHMIWKAELFEGSREQFAFDRVNSFISGGFAADLDSDLTEKEVWDKPNPKQEAGKSEKLSSAGKAKAKARAKAAGRPYPNMVDNIWAARNEEYEGVQRRSNKSLDPDIQKNFKDYKSDQQARHSSNSVKLSWQASPNQTFKMMGNVKPWQNTDSRAKYDATRDKFVNQQNTREIRRFPGKTVAENAEVQSKDKKDPSSRFIGTTSYTNILASDTPGQSSVVKKIKKVVNEATYKGKTVPLNKPMAGDVKKSKVFVDPDGDGKAQKVNFGDKSMSIKKDQPDRKSSYCARSGGQGNLTDKTSANYWSRKAWDC